MGLGLPASFEFFPEDSLVKWCREWFPQLLELRFSSQFDCVSRCLVRWQDRSMRACESEKRAGLEFVGLWVACRISIFYGFTYGRFTRQH